MLRLLYAATAVSIAAELSFTLYVDVYGLLNLIGHFLEIVAFYLIYKAIIETGLVRPYNLLFRNLKQSEEQYRDLYEEAPNAYLSVGIDGRIERANRRTAELLGYRPEEMVGRPVFELYADTAGARGRARELFRKFLDGEQIQDEEMEMRRADGSHIWVRRSVRPIKDNKGQTIGSRLQIVDVTEHKKLNDLKDEFIGLVSHELRSPMTVITGAINTALTEAERLSPEETRQLLEDAAKEADTLSNILGNLLELTRIRANRLTLHAEEISLKKVVQAAIDEVNRLSSDHPVDVNLPRDLPPVYADELRLERILYNLLENAAKYSPAESRIQVTARTEDDHLVISVSDRGPGISRADQARLFAPFERLEEYRTDSTRGLGLGLLVCRRLVEAHGGRIWIESELGRGATFSFTMPLSQEETG